MAPWEKKLHKFVLGATLTAITLSGLVHLFDPFYAGYFTEDSRRKQLIALGEQLYAEKGCVTCHGSDGVSDSSIYPNIAGQPTEYLYNQIRDIQSGRRANAMTSVMKSASDPLTDAEQKALAAYLNSL